MKIFKRLISFALLLNIATILAFEAFIVNDIRIAGLQRVSTGSIFNTIPISVGDKIDDRKIVDITRALFATEQFDDCLLYTSPSPRDEALSRMPSSA